MTKNLDKSKVIVREDRRAKDEGMPLDYNWSRKNGYIYHPDNGTLCVMVEPQPEKVDVDETIPHWHWNVGKPSQIVYVGKEELQEYIIKNAPLKSGQRVLLWDKPFDPDDYDENSNRFNTPRYKQYDITGDCYGVELIEPDVRSMTSGPRFEDITVDKHYFLYPAKEVV